MTFQLNVRYRGRRLDLLQRMLSLHLTSRDARQNAHLICQELVIKDVLEEQEDDERKC